MLFLTAWLGGWALGEVGAARELFGGGGNTPVEFLGFWLLGWTIGGAVALASVVWQLAGREVITVNPALLTYRMEAFGIGHSRSFRASEVNSLRATEYSSNMFTNQWSWFPTSVWFRIRSDRVRLRRTNHTNRTVVRGGGSQSVGAQLSARLPRTSGET